MNIRDITIISTTLNKITLRSIDSYLKNVSYSVFDLNSIEVNLCLIFGWEFFCEVAIIAIQWF